MCVAAAATERQFASELKLRPASRRWCRALAARRRAQAVRRTRGGRVGLALTLLQSGFTVRQLLRQFYGIDSASSWDDAAERRVFRMTLQRAEAVN